mmetsp:Transcript_31257/g.102179  ORF Transcript_31257/g.102179 Transcript_31257/m.102179 type:complete len:266 (-) Transcript_31257:58-855(-)
MSKRRRRKRRRRKRKRRRLEWRRRRRRRRRPAKRARLLASRRAASVLAAPPHQLADEVTTGALGQRHALLAQCSELRVAHVAQKGEVGSCDIAQLGGLPRERNADRLERARHAREGGRCARLVRCLVRLRRRGLVRLRRRRRGGARAKDLALGRGTSSGPRGPTQEKPRECASPPQMRRTRAYGRSRSAVRTRSAASRRAPCSAHPRPRQPRRPQSPRRRPLAARAQARGDRWRAAAAPPPPRSASWSSAAAPAAPAAAAREPPP